MPSAPAYAPHGALYILFGLLLWWGLDHYIQPTSSTQKKDLTQAFGFIMAGVAGVAGVYFAWRNLQSIRENMQLTEQGQITDRFTRAIEQLGSEKIEIRLGGIYALERIANDSPERDYNAVIRILVAYFRES